MLQGAALKSHLQKLSDKYGFIAVGVAAARKLTEEEDRLKSWLEKGYHGTMQYMENHFDKRLDPTLLVPGAKTVISFLYNYYPDGRQNTNAPKVAKYAWGEDYHRVIKDKLYDLVAELQTVLGPFEGRIFVDSAPVMERQWATLAGLGWTGKNSLLLRKGVGSYFFIATIICDLELEPDSPVSSHCGTCTACIDACPTQAIVQDGVIDATKCISYLTIERKSDIPEAFQQKMEGFVFGCDICQDVCPWNQFSTPHTEPRFDAGDWINRDLKAWQNMDAYAFEEQFGKSAITRAGYTKIRETLDFISPQNK
ncbi:MAG: tRNA epoxyqueuosine(34) reductase QueG [Sphingomonadales bacterium]|nr:tRNA epoxyqueuosine(34) reductase QueG [Sphingomonadales bacterium]